MIVADAASVKKVVSVVVPLQSVFLAPTDAQRVNWSFDELHADIVEQTQSKVQRFIRESEIDTQDLDVRCGDPRDEILQAAKEMQADLIVIGSGSRSALNRLLLGSTARSVLASAPCDILVCRGE